MGAYELEQHLVSKLKTAFETILSLKACDTGDFSAYDTIDDFSFIVPCILVDSSKRTTDRSSISSSHDRTFTMIVIYCRYNTEANNYEVRANTQKEGDQIADEIEKKNFWDELRTSSSPVLSWKVEVNYNNSANDIFKAVKAKISAVLIDVTVEVVTRRS